MADSESGSNGDVSKNERQICGEVNAFGYAGSFVGRSDRSGDGEPASNIDMANANGEQLRGGHTRELVSPSSGDEGEAQQRERLWPDAGADGNPIADDDMANAKSYNSRCEAKSSNNVSSQANRSANRNSGCGGSSAFWHNAVWLNGADGKTRRAEPNICLLAHGIPARVGKLRAYGNAIVPPLAAEVIKAFMEEIE
jgi:DNA (cytosine-5)-methyltransferase 1